MRSIAIILSLMFLTAVSETSFAQRQKQLEMKTGTVKELTTSGRKRTLVVTLPGGEEASFPITPKVSVEVKMTGGNEAALQQGNYMTGLGVLTNQQIFLDSASVYRVAENQRLPPSKAQAAEKAVGQSENAYQVSGEIALRQTAPDYPEFEQLMLKSPPTVPVIMFKKDIPVDVISINPDDVKPGQTVELYVIPGRRNKLTLVRAVIDGGQYTPPAGEAAASAEPAK